jgi:hypothetical protein
MTVFDSNTAGHFVVKRIVPLLVVISFLFVSIIHACSGLDAMVSPSLYNSSDDPMIGGKPCEHSKPKKDICQFVRYRMLSIRAESIQDDLSVSTLALPNLVNVHASLPLIDLFGEAERIAFGSSFFRPPPHGSRLVLRI